MTEKRDPIFDFLNSLGELLESTKEEYFMDHGDAMGILDDIDEMYTDLKDQLKQNAKAVQKMGPGIRYRGTSITRG